MSVLADRRPLLVTALGFLSLDTTATIPIVLNVNI